jgi:phage terminase large subunit
MTNPTPTPTTTTANAPKPSKKKLQTVPDNPFVEFVKLYRNNPVLFVREVLNTEPDVWQIEFLNHIAKGNRRISVRSGHGVGKSTASAWAMLWYLFLRFPVKIVVTAPTSSQLYDALFAEVKRWVKVLPPMLMDQLEVKQDRIEMKDANNEAFISARTSRAEQPEALQGVHSDNVMLVADEASGIPEQVFEAAAGSMSGHAAVTLLLGNPVRSSGFFYDTHNRLSGDWVTMKVSCADSPRVSEAYIEEMKARYGEESNAYRIRVLGEFPRSDDDTVIPMELLELATQRDVEASQHATLVWGLDVARFGSDRSALCKRQGNAVLEPIKTWKNLDLMQLTGAVVAEYEILVPSQRPQEILVDSIGLGAGVVDRLKELGLPARGINVAESPAMGGTYRNLKAELWHKAKAWLESRDCRMPKDEALIGELAAVRYSFTSNGKIQIEGKDEIRKRGLPSPDRADAFCLTFASDAVIGMYGSAGSVKWNKPLRRNLPRVA